MKEEKFDEIMTQLLLRTPYQPFTLVLMNGNRYEVDHRNAFSFRDGTGIYTKPGGVPIIFDSDSVSEIIYDLNTQSA